jgi:hypothetical protein
MARCWLYDVTSTYLAGAAWLQPRPPWRPAAACHRPDVRRHSCPVAVEVFEGNTGPIR